MKPTNRKSPLSLLHLGFCENHFRWWALSSLFLLSSIRLMAQTSVPSVECRVVNALNVVPAEGASPPVYQVSNLERISFEVLLKANGNNVVPLNAMMLDPDFALSPDLTTYLSYHVHPDQSTVALPVRVNCFGGFGGDGEGGLMIAIQITEGLEVRQNKLDAVIAEAKAQTQSPADQIALTRIQGHEDLIRDYFDEAYVQNRIGRFWVSFQYQSYQSGSWNGVVSSIPVLIEVLDKGDNLADSHSPTLTAFTPASGSVRTAVTLTGTNFTGATAVRFGKRDADSFTVDSPTQITAYPPGVYTGMTTNSGFGFTQPYADKISVVTPAGTATSATSFSVVTPPWDPPPPGGGGDID